MAKLTGQTIADSYDQLLIVDHADGISSSLQAVESADTGGSASALQISTVAICVSDPTTSSATEGGLLRLQSNDSAAVTGSGHRLGIIEFSGEEDANDTMVAGAQIYAIADAAFTATGTYDHATRLEFAVQDGTSGSDTLAAPAMTIDSTGYVGIGTVSPSQKLVLKTGSLKTDDGYGIKFGTNDTNAAYIYGAEGGSGYIKFATNSTDRIWIDSSGRLLVVSSTAVTGTTTAKLQINGTDNSGSTISIGRFSDNSNAPALQFIKSRNGTVGGNTVVQDGDNLGSISFVGSDGSDTASIAAKIFGEVDGTPGSNDMPGRLTFFTTADGAAAPTERMRIDSSGNVGIGAPSPSKPLHIRVGAEVDDNTILLDVGTVASVGDEQRIGWTVQDTYPLAYIGSSFESDTTDGYLAFGTRSSNSVAEKMRIASSGDVTVSTGDLIFGTAGKGIVLGATSNTDANTLDDYEEGTWTGVYSCASGGDVIMNGSYTTGTYTKIGNMVTVCGVFISSDLDGGTGNVTLTGLPFTVGGSARNYSSVSVGAGHGLTVTAGNNISGESKVGDTYFILYIWDAVQGVSYLQHDELTLDGNLTISCTYQIS